MPSVPVEVCNSALFSAPSRGRHLLNRSHFLLGRRGTAASVSDKPVSVSECLLHHGAETGWPPSCTFFFTGRHARIAFFPNHLSAFDSPLDVSMADVGAPATTQMPMIASARLASPRLAVPLGPFFSSIVFTRQQTMIVS